MTTTYRNLFNPQRASNRLRISVDASYEFKAGHRGKLDKGI